MTTANEERLTTELAGALATIEHQCEAMSWIAGHDRQGLDHLQEAMDAATERDALWTALDKARALVDEWFMPRDGTTWANPHAHMERLRAALAPACGDDA